MKTKITSFDYIKIIAATCIVFHHYQLVFDCKFPYINFSGGLFGFGYFVELFFIISGFLTMYSHKNWEKTRDLIKVFIKKLLRLFPLAILTQFVCLMLVTLSAYINGYDFSPYWNLKSLVANFCLLFSGYPYFETFGYNNPLWYVCILIQCYIVFYVFMWIIQKINAKRFTFPIFAILFLVILVLRRLGLLNASSFRGLSSFLIGVLIEMILVTNQEIFRKYQAWVIGGLILSGIILTVPAIRMGIEQCWILEFLWFPILVVVAYIIKIPENEVVTKLGAISFDVYVWHSPLILLTQVATLLTGYELPKSYWSMIGFTFFVWGIATLSYKYMELPIGKKLLRISE